MIKYNKSQIFKDAWNLVKTQALNLSQALKQTWANAKKGVVMNKETQINAFCSALVEAGYSAKIWKDCRIYLNGMQKGCTAYIELDEPNCKNYDQLWQGCALKVYQNTYSQN